MTRGTPYLILKSKVVCSDEFNGDMYGSPKDSKELQRSGLYSEMVGRLKKVRDEGGFRKEMKAFNRENHNYHLFGFYGLSGNLLEEIGYPDMRISPL